MSDEKIATEYAIELDQYFNQTTTAGKSSMTKIYKLSKKNKYQLVSYGCDYLKLKVDIAENDAEFYTDNLQELTGKKWRSEAKSKTRTTVKDLEYINIVKQLTHEANERGYKFAFLIFVEGSNHAMRIYIRHCKNNYKDSLQLSIQINPNKQSVLSIKNFRKAIALIFGKEFLKSIGNMKVTRFDFSYDISDLETSTLFYTYANRQIFSSHIGRDGEIGTLNFGNKDDGVCIYNKQAEMKEKPRRNDSYVLGTKIPVQAPNVPMTRVEFRKKTNIEFSNFVTGTKIPTLEDIKFYAINGPFKLDPVFKMAAKAYGLQPVLRALETKESNKVKKSLAANKIDIPVTEEDLSGAMLLTELLCCNIARRKEITKQFSKNQQKYIHTGVVTYELLNLANARQGKVSKEQRQILSVLKGDTAKAIGNTITKAQAMALIKLGEDGDNT